MGRKRLTGKENFAARTDTGLAGEKPAGSGWPRRGSFVTARMEKTFQGSKIINTGCLLIRMWDTGSQEKIIRECFKKCISSLS
jgi:hypothetical protein